MTACSSDDLGSEVPEFTIYSYLRGFQAQHEQGEIDRCSYLWNVGLWHRYCVLLEDSEKVLTLGRQLCPEEPSILGELALTQYQLGKFEEADTNLRTAIRDAEARKLQDFADQYKSQLVYMQDNRAEFDPTDIEELSIEARERDASCEDIEAAGLDSFVSGLK